MDCVTVNSIRYYIKKYKKSITIYDSDKVMLSNEQSENILPQLIKIMKLRKKVKR